MNSYINTPTKIAFSAIVIVFQFFHNAEAQGDLEWQPFEKALTIAITTNRPVLIDVWAPWCGWCRKMKRDVYSELEQQMNTDFVLTRLNRDDNKTEYRYQGGKFTSLQLAKKLRSQSVPAIVFLSPDGDFLLDVSGYIEAEELRPVLTYISSRSYEGQEFDNSP